MVGRGKSDAGGKWGGNGGGSFLISFALYFLTGCFVFAFGDCLVISRFHREPLDEITEALRIYIDWTHPGAASGKGGRW